MRRWLLALLGLTACRAPEAQEGAVELTRVPAPPTVTVAQTVSSRGPDGCLRLAPSVPEAPAPPHPLSGRLGLWAAEVDPATLQPLRAVATQPDSVFPLASTYKQAVLWALLRAVDAGQVKAGERFNVTRDNQSLGIYPYDGSDVRTLTGRMITYSDNTATDILHRRVGLRAVQATADDLGLCHTRLILPTRTWWVALAGLSKTFSGTSRWAGARGEARVRLAALIDQDARAYRADYVQRRLDDYFDHRYDPDNDLRALNISTPYEFGTLVAHAFLRPDLSPRSQKWQRDVMAQGFGRSALKLTHQNRVAYVGGKGGNGWRLLTYSGYVKTVDGRHLVYVFMQHGAKQTYTMPNTRRAFAWINAALEHVLKQEPTGAAP